MKYLEIHGIKDGQKTFHCGTRYDIYLIQRIKPYTKTNIIDENGNTIDGDKILALLTKELISKNKLNKRTVVATMMSNLGFENYLKEVLGVKLVRTAVGDINIIKEMQINSYSLGGEQSGHIIINAYSKTADGILAALKVLELLKKSKRKTSELFDIYIHIHKKK